MTNITDAITIKRATSDFYLVEIALANGWTQAQSCTTEEEARAYVAGIRDGFRLVGHAIGNGLHFNGRIETVTDGKETQ